MLRTIVLIDEEKCNGCGLCAAACHEGAIEIVNGKARLMREDYCDGMGDCLPACPNDAISFERREAAAYDEQAVKAHLESRKAAQDGSVQDTVNQKSELKNWPTQIKLLPVNAPFLENADLLIAADCTAFAYGNIQSEFIKNRVVINGCPKLDGVNYAEKLTEIFKYRNINSVTLLRMTVPCCGGLELAAKRAINESGKDIPFSVAVISTNGEKVSG